MVLHYGLYTILFLFISSLQTTHAFTPHQIRKYRIALSSLQRQGMSRRIILRSQNITMSAPTNNRQVISSVRTVNHANVTSAFVDNAIIDLKHQHNDHQQPRLLRNNIKDISNEQEMRHFLTSNPHTILVIKFFSPYCKTCQAMAPLYKKLSCEPIFQKKSIIFAAMSSGRISSDMTLSSSDLSKNNNNKKLFDELGIKALPTVAIYYNAGSESRSSSHLVNDDEGEQEVRLIHRMPSGPRNFKAMKNKLHDIVTSSEFKSIF